MPYQDVRIKSNNWLGSLKARVIATVLITLLNKLCEPEFVATFRDYLFSRHRSTIVIFNKFDEFYTQFNKILLPTEDNKLNSSSMQTKIYRCFAPDSNPHQGDEIVNVDSEGTFHWRLKFRIEITPTTLVLLDPTKSLLFTTPISLIDTDNNIKLDWSKNPYINRLVKPTYHPASNTLNTLISIYDDFKEQFYSAQSNQRPLLMPSVSEAPRGSIVIEEIP